MNVHRIGTGRTAFLASVCMVPVDPLASTVPGSAHLAIHIGLVPTVQTVTRLTLVQDVARRVCAAPTVHQTALVLMALESVQYAKVTGTSRATVLTVLPTTLGPHATKSAHVMKAVQPTVAVQVYMATAIAYRASQTGQVSIALTVRQTTLVLTARPRALAVFTEKRTHLALTAMGTAKDAKNITVGWTAQFATGKPIQTIA